MLRILAIVSSAVLIVFTNSCNGLKEYTQFNMKYAESVTIPSSTGVNLPLNIPTSDIETNAESTFEVNDTRKDLIEEILLESLMLELRTPTSGNFGFLKSITIFLNADGLDEVEIAWNKEVPSDVGKSLELQTTDKDLQEYLKADEFSLRVNTVTDEIMTSDHVIDLTADFFVDAKVLGQ